VLRNGALLGAFYLQVLLSEGVADRVVAAFEVEAPRTFVLADREYESHDGEQIEEEEFPLVPEPEERKCGQDQHSEWYVDADETTLWAMPRFVETRSGPPDEAAEGLVAHLVVGTMRTLDRVH